MVHRIKKENKNKNDSEKRNNAWICYFLLYAHSQMLLFTWLFVTNACSNVVWFAYTESAPYT